MKLPLIASLLLCTSLACADEYPASRTYIRQAEIIEKMNALYPTVEVQIMWVPCGMENSFYIPLNRTIVLCTEFEKYPDTAVYVAAHEMAHAITHQLTDTTSEQDADELAAISMIRLGYAKEVLVAAVYWLQQDSQGRTGEQHPANGFRAWELACLAAGSDGGSKECRDLYAGLSVRWDNRLRTEYTTLTE